MNSNPSQRTAVLRHLELWGSITDMQALSDYGIRRLASRINELRKLGHAIDTEMVTVATRHGEARVAEYRLASKGQQELQISC